MSVLGKSFYNASGIDSEDRAKMVFVRRVSGPDDVCSFVQAAWSEHSAGQSEFKPDNSVSHFRSRLGAKRMKSSSLTTPTARRACPAVIVGPCSAVLEFKLAEDFTGGSAVRAIVSDASPPKSNHHQDTDKGIMAMTDMLLDVTGEDTTGTSMFIYYLNPESGVYTLLGSAVNTTAADTAATGVVVRLCFHILPWSIFRLALAATLATSWFSTRAAQLFKRV